MSLERANKRHRRRLERLARGYPNLSLSAMGEMMQSVRESSQQDRRVYVGNLSYDVKWHHLKDFMRQGEPESYIISQPVRVVSCLRWKE